ncbi:MAG TPA: heparin lyase I family protein [Vicinamibacterales bacterium]
MLWSADHDTGDLSQWYEGDGGGEFNSGSATSTASDDVARSGRFSAKATIVTPHVPETSGVRLFRWTESHFHQEACYGAWLYFPQQYIVPLWWNILQFKSRSGSTLNDVFWSLQVGNRPRGPMFVYLNWWEGLSIEGPHQDEFGGRSYSQTVKDIPVRRWTHLQVYLRQSSTFEGQIIVWQDDVELFNMNGVRTRYPSGNGANEWSVNNYSDILSPSPTTIYIDDAAITTASVEPSSAGASGAR